MDPIVFEFDKNSSPMGMGNTIVTIAAAAPANDVATAMAAAINGHPTLQIDAMAHGALVTLQHQRATSLGEQPITEQVADPAFYKDGMHGGLGGDCDTNDECSTNADCASNVCLPAMMSMPKKCQ